MSYDISETGIFGDAPAEDVNADLPDTNNDAESDAGALDVDPSLANHQPPAGQEEQTPKTGKSVPLTALQEERQRRQERDAELARERENNRILQDRFNQYLLAQQQQQQQVQQQQPEIPAFADDPEGHLKALTQQFEQRIAQLQQGNQQSQQFQQEAQMRQQLVNEALASEAAYKAKVPDYDAAAAFLTNRKVAEYMALGMDQVSASQRVSMDYFGLAAHARQTGRDPADMVYGLAKAIGYTAAVPGKQPPAQQHVPPQNPAPTSLSSLPGATTAEDDGKLTAAKLNAMSDKEFEKLCADMRRAAGGSQRPRT